MTLIQEKMKYSVVYLSDRKKYGYAGRRNLLPYFRKDLVYFGAPSPSLCKRSLFSAAFE